MMVSTPQALAAAMLLLSTDGRAASSACVDFVNFCDGLELTIAEGLITGTWQSYACQPGEDVAVSGRVRGGEVQVVCRWQEEGCNISPYTRYYDFAFFLDPVSSTFDLYAHDSQGNLLTYQVGSPFDVVGAPCPFANDRTGRSSIAP